MLCHHVVVCLLNKSCKMLSWKPANKFAANIHQNKGLWRPDTKQRRKSLHLETGTCCPHSLLGELQAVHWFFLFSCLNICIYYACYPPLSFKLIKKCFTCILSKFIIAKAAKNPSNIGLPFFSVFTKSLHDIANYKLLANYISLYTCTFCVPNLVSYQK